VGQKRVAVVGFGYVGTIMGAYLASRGLPVMAIESREAVVDSIQHGRMHIREAGLSEVLLPLVQKGSVSITRSPEAIKDTDTVIVTVGTPLGRGRAPDLSALTQVAAELAPHLHRGHLVILKSTIPPGTTRTVVAPILEKAGLKAGVDFYLAYCPERLAEGNALSEVPQLPVVVSGINEASTESAERFWQAAGLQTVRVGSLEAAELVKLADNVWIDLTIALTNELARVCERLGVDALDVIRAANTLKKGQSFVNYLHPGIGVGGSCLTKDPWFFADLAASVGWEVRLPKIGREVNEMVPSHVATTISSELRRRGGVQGAKVAILGFAFKGSTGDTRNTPVKPIVNRIRRSGWTVAIYDPWVPSAQIQEESGISPQSSLEACVRDAACVLVATGHPEFVGLKPAELRAAAPGCIVYDGWHVLDSTEFVRAGFEYFSPGKHVGSSRA
jgi:UDP-N-acetyl-D-mannosaminuronic acid dehydrogenase